MNTLPNLQAERPVSGDGVRFGVSFEFGVRLAPEYVVWLVAAVATVVTGVQYI